MPGEDSTATPPASPPARDHDEDELSRTRDVVRRTPASVAVPAASPPPASSPAPNDDDDEDNDDVEDGRETRSSSNGSSGGGGSSKKQRSQAAPAALSPSQDGSSEAGSEQQARREDAKSGKSSKSSGSSHRNSRRKHHAGQSAAGSSAKSGTSMRSRRGSNGVHRRITLYLNGDVHFAGRPYVLDPKLTPTFEQLLDHLTKLLDPAFGIVHRIYAVPEEKEVFSIEEIVDGKSYVACGKHRLKSLNYLGILDFKAREASYIAPDLSHLKVQPAVNGRWNITESPLAISVLANGDESGSLAKLLLTKRDRETMVRVYDFATERLQTKLEYGNVIKLFTMEGKEISSPDQLKENTVYVAVDRLPFKEPPFTTTREGTLVRKPARKIVLKTLPVIVPKKPARELSQLEQLDRKVKARKRAEQRMKQQQQRRQQSRGSDSESDDDDDWMQHDYFPGDEEEHGSPTKPRKSIQKDVRSPDVKSDNDEEDAPPLHDRSTGEIHKPDGSAEGAAAGHTPLDKAQAKLTAIYEKLSKQLSFDETTHALEELQAQLRNLMYHHRGNAPDATTAFDDRIEEVLQYMMAPSDGTNEAKSPADIKRRFEPMVLAALGGQLSHWESQAAAFTALVILLDQFPRSIYRGSSKMFEGDELCREIVLRAIFQTNIMDEVHPVYRLFPCLALTHQEDVDMQKLCISEWTRASAFFEANDPIRDYGRTFETNLEIIKEFGRFPDRNEALGRTSTPQELTFLAGESRGTRRSNPLGRLLSKKK